MEEIPRRNILSWLRGSSALRNDTVEFFSADC
jgi:hypothetical protein